MKNTVNIALQIIPSSKEIHPYTIVDEAISIIKKSGIIYRVTPFETVMEGTYDEIMNVITLAQEACYKGGADSLMTYIKIQSSSEDVHIDDKMHKYE